jgi:hypothetical protein
MSKMAFKKNVPLKAAAILCTVVFAYGIWITVWARSGAQLEAARPGISSCHHCGMIVSDLKQSVSVLDQDRQGNTVTRHFDDVGCFLSFAVEKNTTNFSGVAHDYVTGQTLDVNEARFFLSRQATPMGSGWLATANKSTTGAVPLDQAVAQMKKTHKL